MKRILLAVFLLLVFAVPAWGVARTLYPAQDAMNWSAAEWSLADDNAKNQAKPAGGDTVYFSGNSGDVTLDENSAALAALSMAAAGDYVGTLALGANTLTVDGVCLLVGTITGTGTIDAGEGTFSQEAAVANTVTLLLTTSGSHAIVWAGTGGSVNINATGTYTLATNCNSYALTVTAGTLAGAGYTWTVGAGGFTFTNGTISGTLTIDLSAAAGAYTQTDGTIAAAAVLNVTTGSGGFAWTALTKTGTLNVTVTASMTGSWNTGAAGTNLIDLLTVNSPATLTADDYLYARAIAGTGLVAGATIGINPTSDNFWTLSGTGSSADLLLRPTTSVSNAALIDIGAGNYLQNNPFIPTLNGGLTCGDVALRTAAGATLVCNGPLTASGTVTLGFSTSYGTLTLGPNQVHRIGGDLARSGTSNSNAFNPRGRVILGGTMTGTGIVVTPTYEGVIDCVGVGSVYDVTSTGRRLVVRRAVHHTTGIPLRGWEDDSCTNVRFLPHKVIGAPGVN